MSKEDIIKMIEAIDEQLERNEEFIKAHDCADVLILYKLSELLLDARKGWTHMLLNEYGIIYL